MNDRSKKIFYCVTAVLLVVIIIWLGVSGIKAIKNAKGNGNRSDTETVSTSDGKLYENDNSSLMEETVTISTEIIEDGLRNIGKLVTQEYYFTQVETYEKTEQVILISTAKVVYSYDGVVSAGINCNDITVTKDDDAKTITINLPASEIQYVEIDNDSFQVYEEKQGLWSKIKMSDLNTSLSEFKERAKENAINKGLLKNADSNAEVMIRAFMDSILGTEASDYSVDYVHTEVND